MGKYPTPDGRGFWWAKLIHPSGVPEDDVEGYRSVHWEVVSVDINDPNGQPGDPEYVSVLVPGLEPTQWVEDFVWGPRVPDFEPESA